MIVWRFSDNKHLQLDVRVRICLSSIATYHKTIINSQEEFANSLQVQRSHDVLQKPYAPRVKEKQTLLLLTLLFTLRDAECVCKMRI